MERVKHYSDLFVTFTNASDLRTCYIHFFLLFYFNENFNDEINIDGRNYLKLIIICDGFNIACRVLVHERGKQKREGSKLKRLMASARGTNEAWPGRIIRLVWDYK